EPLIAPEDPHRGHVVALLPGSRAYARDSVSLMVAAVGRLAEGVTDGRPVTALVAWTPGDVPAPPPGWSDLAPSRVAPGEGGGGLGPAGRGAASGTAWRRG